MATPLAKKEDEKVEQEVAAEDKSVGKPSKEKKESKKKDKDSEDE